MINRTSSTPDHQSQNINLPSPSIDRFLVCGLGSLGQHCVAALKQFGVIVNGIDLIQPQHWEISDLYSQLNQLIIGDAREANILTQAQVQHCRAILIVTSNERVNLAIALVARLLNPQIRLVVRSAKKNLNQLLGQQLGNYVAFEPTELPAPAFAVAALEEEIIGFFYLEKHQIRIVQRQIKLDESWCDRPIYQLNNRHRKVISYATNDASLSSDFYEWDAEELIQPNDNIIYIEELENFARTSQAMPRKNQFDVWQILRSIFQTKPRDVKNLMINYWHWIQEHPIRNLVFSSGLTLGIFLFSGTLLFWFYYPETTLRAAFYSTAILLLGGFGDIFGGIKLERNFPWWLQFFSLTITLVGIIFVALLNGLITERLLSTRFKFTRRNPIPTQDHVVLVGLGRVGQRVATLLQGFKQKLVAISSTATELDITPKIPLVRSKNIIESLEKVNLATAKGVIAVTNNEMLNLEVALMAYAVNPNIRLVIRTSEQRFSDNLARLLPYSGFICTSAVVAEAFAGAAFGENILSLFRIAGETVLVTEYNIEAGDTLNGLILAEIAYGYQVVPVLYTKTPNESKLMPSDDIRLAVGDRLIILATINGLKRIENGEIKQPNLQVMIEAAPSEYAIFQGANEVAGISGCSMNQAREFMNNLPGILPKLLYKHQAQRLVRTLKKAFVRARLI